MRRSIATDAEVKHALFDLDHEPERVNGRDWPNGLSDLSVSGLYSWWVDERGARQLTEGLGTPVRAARIYAGQTGATKWPSGIVGSMTLRRRIGQNHLRGTIRGSTFRRTLAAVLREVLVLRVIEPGRLDRSSEVLLTEWVADHLEVAVHPFRDPDPLADLEHKVLLRLDPPLNLTGMPPTPARSALALLRQGLSRADS